MNTFRMSNVSLRDMRMALKKLGFEKCNVSKGRGGHEKWVKNGMQRPIIVQTHKDPVPEHIVRQIMRHLDFTRDEFKDLLQSL